MSIQEKIKGFFSNISAGVKGSSKGIKIATIAILVLALLGGVWGLWWFPKRQAEASKLKAQLHFFFESDSMSVVINGLKGKNKVVSAPEIATKYWMTDAGKECAIMAAEAYMKTGKWQQAIDFYDKTNVRDPFLGPIILAAKAGCYAELKKYDKAGDLYLKAAEFGKNDITDKYYLYSGMHYELAKDYKKALKSYELAKSRSSEDAKSIEPELGEIDKYIAKAKALVGDYKE